MTQTYVRNQQGLASLFAEGSPIPAPSPEDLGVEMRGMVGGHFPNLPPTPAPAGFELETRKPLIDKATPRIGAGRGIKPGQRFGSLVAVDRAGVETQYGMKRSMWRFACDCGRVVTLPPYRARTEVHSCSHGCTARAKGEAAE